MEPDEVAMAYWKQAKTLEVFLKAITAQDYSANELKLILNVIGKAYCDLLYNLAKFTPTLQSYNIQFYKIDSYEEPPFDKDFFNKEL